MVATPDPYGLRRPGRRADPSFTRKLHRGLIPRRERLVVAVDTYVTYVTYVPAEFGSCVDAKLAVDAR
jgi:hypothetical protein